MQSKNTGQAGPRSVHSQKKTGLDVPTIMEEVAKVTGEDKRMVEGFLCAIKALSEANDDPEFYKLAMKAIGEP